MSKYEDDGLDCCRGIVNAILLSLSLWAVILGVSYGAWRSWHTGRLADATVIFGFVGLILVGLSAWFRHQHAEIRVLLTRRTAVRLCAESMPAQWGADTWPSSRTNTSIS